jgi:hypothetical protein
LGVVHNSVELLAGGHAAVIFGKCRGSEPHAGSPRFAVLVFNAPSVGMARAPGCTLTAPSFTTVGQTPSARPSRRIGDELYASWCRVHVCVCMPEGESMKERERENQPAFSPLGTTGANFMAFLFFHLLICVYVCLGRGWVVEV